MCDGSMLPAPKRCLSTEESGISRGQLDAFLSLEKLKVIQGPPGQLRLLPSTSQDCCHL